MVIPEQLGGSPVMGIGDEAFRIRQVESAVVLEGVESIGVRAFAGCKQMTSVVLPRSLADIGSEAFAGCIRLEEVDLPGGVTNIGPRAFLGCERLTSVAVPDGVVSIGELAFALCRDLESVAVGTGGVEIGPRAFQSPKLAEVRIAEGNPAYTSADGAVLSKDGRTFVWCTALRKGEYAVPDGVETIGAYAFHCCLRLKRVVLPGSVREIGEGAFRMCPWLESVFFVSGVRRIEREAFAYSPRLTEWSLPESVESIDAETFRGSNVRVFRVPASWKGTPMMEAAWWPRDCLVEFVGEREEREGQRRMGREWVGPMRMRESSGVMTVSASGRRVSMPPPGLKRLMRRMCRPRVRGNWACSRVLPS